MAQSLFHAQALLLPASFARKANTNTLHPSAREHLLSLYTVDHYSPVLDDLGVGARGTRGHRYIYDRRRAVFVASVYPITRPARFHRGLSRCWPRIDLHADFDDKTANEGVDGRISLRPETGN